MPCATPVGTSIQFGIPSEELSLLTKQVSVTRLSDRKEARDGCGEVQSVAWYNKRSEISISCTGMVGNTMDDVGIAITMAAGNLTIFAGLIVGSVYSDRITATMNQEDFITTDMDLVAWDSVP
jgi:hypothetical protein